MEYRRLGRSDLEVSVIGFGTWELGGDYGAIVKQEADAAIHRALDLGVTLFDTAPAYGQGRSEEVLGQALGPRRKDVILVTKVGVTWDENDNWFFEGSRESIFQEVEDSLRRLQTDYIDLLLVHRPDLQTPLPEVVSALDGIRRSGKARHIGVSNFSIAQLEEIESYGPIVVNQVGYNLFDRRTEETIHWCGNKGIGIMAYGSLCFGLLTGAITEDTQFDEDDWRGVFDFGQDLFGKENLGQNVRVVQRLQEKAAALRRTLPQLAIRWVLSNPQVTAALTGCRAPAEIEENVKVTGWSLSESDMAAIAAIMERAAGLSDQTWP